MSAEAILPDHAERQRDALQLGFLAMWEDGFSVGQIARAFGVSRNIPLGVVHRIHLADPTALTRKPETQERE